MLNEDFSSFPLFFQIYAFPLKLLLIVLLNKYFAAIICIFRKSLSIYSFMQIFTQSWNYLIDALIIQQINEKKYVNSDMIW